MIDKRLLGWLTLGLFELRSKEKFLRFTGRQFVRVTAPKRLAISPDALNYPDSALFLDIKLELKENSSYA